MEKEYFHSTEGQEVAEDDINGISLNAALADEHVLAELFRLKPFDSISMTAVTKSVLSYSEGPSIIPNGASGSVRIYPLRPIVASPVVATTDADQNWRDVRSHVYIGNLTSTFFTQAISANVSSDPRWDLIYIRLDRDVTDTPVVRYVKSISGETPTTLAVSKITTTTAGVVIGTTSPTPNLPSLPSDSGSTFYVPLVYVRVPSGFNSTSIVLTKDIFEVTPVVPLSHVTGSNTSRPASCLNTPGSDALTTTRTQNWGSTGNRIEVYMPSCMTGEESLYISLNLQDPSSSNWSQLNTSVIDDTKDWRNRLFTWQAVVDSDSTHKFAWDTAAVGSATLPVGRFAQTVNSTSSTMAVGFGQTMIADTSTVSYICTLNNTNVGGGISSPNSIQIYVDQSDGKIRMAASSPGVRAFIKISATSQFNNK